MMELTKQKFILYSILTSFIWGSLLFLELYEFAKYNYFIAFFISIQATDILRDFLFESKEEKELERERFNQPVTINLLLKLMLKTVLIVTIAVFFFNYGEYLEGLLAKNLVIALANVGIGVLWSLSIYKAWLKTVIE